MSAKVESKKFGKSTRSVPHHSEKAQKWYPAEDESKPRKVRSDARYPESTNSTGITRREMEGFIGIVGDGEGNATHDDGEGSSGSVMTMHRSENIKTRLAMSDKRRT